MENSVDNKKREAESPSSSGIDRKSKPKTASENCKDSFHGRVDEDKAAVLLAFAARNKKNRFFVPSKSNAFAGIPYEHVMIDNGCNSALLPFPTDRASLERFANPRFTWSVSVSQFQSLGTGVVRSPPVLKIKSMISFEFPVELNGKEMPVRIPFLRFHLGKESANFVRNHEPYYRQLLGDGCSKQALDRLLTDLAEKDHAPERRHVLLGQSFIGQVFSAQLGDIILFLDKTK